MGLEEILYGSKTIRDYLKLYSEQQWNRVSKATILLGIQYLKYLSNNDLRQLSVKSIEDIVVQNSLEPTKIVLPHSSKPHRHKKHNKENQDGDKDKRKKKQKQKKTKKAQDEDSMCGSSRLLDTSQNINMTSQSSLQPSIPDSTSKPLKEEKKIEKPAIIVNQRQAAKIKAQSSEEALIKPVALKAPSSWRRGTSQKPEKYESRFQVDNPHQADKKPPRSQSLNPLIYPSWWGEDDDFEQVGSTRRALDEGRIGTRARSGKEDSLDKRLKEVETSKKNQMPVAILQNQSTLNPTQTYFHQQNNGFQSNGRQDASPSYGYTSSKYVSTYSPARNARPGANNIPMSYSGPPTEQEVNRNKNRHLHNTNYDYQRPVEAQGFGGRGGGGVILSYTPPKEKKNRGTKKDKKAKNRTQKAPHTLPPGQKKPAAQTLYYQPQYTLTNNRGGTSQNQAQSRPYSQVQSRIKDQILFHKRVHKEKQHSNIFSKEPEILFKAEPPKELYVGAPSAKSSGKNGGASLRRKNSPHKDVIANNGQAQPNIAPEVDQTEQFSLRNTQGQWPSSIEQLNNSNQRSTGQYFYNPQRGRNQQLEGAISGGPGTVGEITQGLINSPIMSQYTESSPERDPRLIAVTNEPSVFKQNRTGPNGQTIQTVNESGDQVIMFRSDGFDQSRFQQQPNQQNNLSRFSRHPQPNANYQVASSGEMDSSALSGGGFQKRDVYNHGVPLDNSGMMKSRPSNPFAKNIQQQNQSYLSGYQPVNKTNGDGRQLGSGRHQQYDNQYPVDQPYGANEDSNTYGQYLPEQPKANNWVGDYLMAGNRGAEQRERNLHELAQSNSYTYTLQKPINSGSSVTPKNHYYQASNDQRVGSGRMDHRGRPHKGFQTFQDEEDYGSSSEDSEESDLSNYSPSDEIRGFFQNQYQPNVNNPTQSPMIYQDDQPSEPMIYNQVQRPYDYIPQQNRAQMLQGVELTDNRHHKDLNINENQSESIQEEFSSDDGQMSPGGSGSSSPTSYYTSEVSSSTYSSQADMHYQHPATAASGFYRGGRDQPVDMVHNQTHHL